MAVTTVSSKVLTTSKGKTRQGEGVRDKSKGQGLEKNQLRELFERLTALSTEIHNAIEEKALIVINNANEPDSLIKGDDAEVAEKQRSSSAALQELDILKNRLRLVQRALRKIPEGVYGLCEETEEQIGFERLAVVPWARYCVHVQEKREKLLRDFRGNRLKSE